MKTQILLILILSILTSTALASDLIHNTPTLDLNNPRLESKDYAALGLPILTIPTTLKTTITQYEKAHPTPNTPKLATCPLTGLHIETDDNPNTQEWLITPKNTCTQTRNKPFWILQQTRNQTPTVIAANHAAQIRIWTKQNPNDPNRRIELIRRSSAKSRHTQQPIPVQCHIDLSGNPYQARPSYVEIYRDDPMSRSKNWITVDGQDPYAAIDNHYVCR